MDAVIRTYMKHIESARWMPREEWAGKDQDPESDVAGSKVTLTGVAGAVWISSAVPTPLDHDNLSVSVSADVEGGMLGIEWCQAKRGKSHPIVWAEDDVPGVLEDVLAVPTTASFRLVVRLGDSGTAEVDVSACIGISKPALKVHVNQVGYNAGQPKTFVVEANAPLEGEATFRVISPIHGPGQEFVTVNKGALASAGPVEEWGRWYWKGEFSALDEAGNYYIEATVGGLTAESPMFTIAPNYLAGRTLDATQRFFWFQRCGMEIPGWHAACHLDDRVTTPEGVTIEAAGAWHDAGDYNKYNGFTPISVYSLAYVADQQDALCETRRHNAVSDVLDEALWGAAYLAKVQDPMTGKLWGQHFSGYGYWGIPEKETDNRIGGDDDRVAKGESKNPFFVASFARLARILGNEEYLGRALKHWDLCYDPDAKGIAALADALIAALELQAATGEERFPEAALACAKGIVACQGSDDTYDGFFRGSSEEGPAYFSLVTNGQPAAALALWTLANPEHPFADDARKSLLAYNGYQRALSANAFGISKVYKAEGEAWFFPFKKDGDWHVGENSHYLSDAWAAFLTYRATGDEDALAFGLDQLNWVMGMNPYGICMVHDMGKIHTATTHHRYNSIPGQPQGSPTGSVFNGIVRFNAANDIPLWDLLPQGTPRYECNEPWLPHNAYYLLAITELANVCQAGKA